MRKLLLLPLAVAAAGATTPSRAQIPVRGETPGHICKAGGTARFIGRRGTSRTAAAIKRATHAALLRWARPGVMMTMDYREDRVTVHLGPNRRITQISCG